MSAVSTVQPYPANSLAGAGWLRLRLGLGLGWVELGQAGAEVSLAKESVLRVSAVGTVQLLNFFLTF